MVFADNVFGIVFNPELSEVTVIAPRSQVLLVRLVVNPQVDDESK